MEQWSRVRRKLAGLGQRLSSMSEFPWAQEWPEITDPRVKDAFNRVPRVEFVPELYRDLADRDAPLPIGQEQTISQPFVVALMVQALNVRPGDKVLEIGTGSGYQTAILSELTQQEGVPAGQTVYSIERFDSLATRAADVLKRLGYAPHLRIGDGARGWAEMAPFDSIILSASPAYLPRPLWDQLADCGRLVAPLGIESQLLWLLTKESDRMIAENMGPVRFVPLVTTLLNDPGQRMVIESQW